MRCYKDYHFRLMRCYKDYFRLMRWYKDYHFRLIRWLKGYQCDIYNFVNLIQNNYHCQDIR